MEYIIGICKHFLENWISEVCWKKALVEWKKVEIEQYSTGIHSVTAFVSNQE